MRRTRAPAALLGLGLLVACQTTEAPSPVTQGGASRFSVPQTPQPDARKVAERKGWVVEAVTGSFAEPAHCRATRPGDSGPKLTFQTSPGRFSVLIGTPNRLLAPGATYDLTFAFEGAASESHTAQAVDSDTLAVRISSLDYEDITDPYARAKRLEVSSPRLGGHIAAFPLAGSNWAINAIDECRRIHTKS
ncbi:MAG TPA: hypothetical protein VD978_01425 [Azospirillum sp.]|nr:hypothetical protein [Azospirillum sp.]